MRAEETHGPEGARAQLADNMALVVAVILPAAAGTLAVPAESRGADRARRPIADRSPPISAPMLPGLAAFVLMMYAVAPIFQIAKRTAPMIVAALAALGAEAALVAALPRGEDGILARQRRRAARSLVGFGVALLFAWAARPQWPRARDLFGALGRHRRDGARAVAAARATRPGAALLAAEATLGAAIYGALAWIFDVARLRRRAEGDARPGEPLAAGPAKNS